MSFYRRPLITVAIAAAALAALPAHAWKQKEFVISFWSPPPPAETTAERYAEIARAGFTTTLGGNGINRPDLNRKMLDLSRQNKMNAIVLDDRIYGGKAANVGAVVKENSHPALEGFLVMDEPNASQFPALRATVDALKKADVKRLALINLFPTYATPDQLGAPTYDQYVKQYLDTVKPEVLVFDHYPFLTSGDRPDYLENLEIIRRHSLDRRIPFWSIVQAEGIEGAYRSPTETEMRNQVFTSLAYGAKGIFYFTYWTPDPGAEKHFDGIVALGGKTRARYEWVQRLNEQIRNLAPILMPLRSQGVYQIVPAPPEDARGEGSKNVNPLPKGTKALSHPLITKAVGGPATVGIFDGPKRNLFLWVVNREPNRYARVDFRFNESKMRQLVEHQLDGEVSDNLLRTDLKFPARYEVRLGPGEGRLFEIPEYSR